MAFTPGASSRSRARGSRATSIGRKRVGRRGSESASTVTGGAAGSVLGRLSRSLAGLELLGSDVQRQFTTWSTDPPLNSSRQVRFANKLDGWVQAGTRILREIQAAEIAGQQLPPFGACSAEQKIARRVLAGLRAMKTQEVLQALFARLQVLANRARQPMGSEEAARLWDQFAALVFDMGGMLNEVRAIRRLIRELIENSAEHRVALRERQARIATGSSGSAPTVGTALRLGEEAKTGLERLDAAVDRLRNGIAKIVDDLSKMAVAKRGREHLVSLHEEVLTTLAQYEQQLMLFRTAVEISPQVGEILAAGEGEATSEVARAVRELVEQIREKELWCCGWLNVIRCREEAAFRLTPEIPEELARCVADLSRCMKQADVAGYLDDPGGSRQETTGDVMGFEGAPGVDAEAKQILGVMAAGAARPWTVKELAEATGLGEQAVRRRLQRPLGEEGLGLVARTKSKRTAADKSPAHSFTIAPDRASLVKLILSGT